MKRNTKRLLALFLTAALTVTPISAVRAQDSGESGESIRTEEVAVAEEPAIQEENPVVRGEEPTLQTEDEKADEEQESLPQDPTEDVQTEESMNTVQTSDVFGKTTVFSDGEYLPTEFTFTGGTGKVQITCEKVVIKEGNITAWIVFSSDKYTTVEINGTKYTSEMIDGKNTFKIPADLNCDLSIAALTTAMSQERWVNYTIHITLPEGSTPITDQEPEPAPGENPGEESGEEEEPGEEEPGTPALADGMYHMDVTTSSSMFKVVDCVLIAGTGQMRAVITLSGTGYDKLYMGTAEEAKNADASELISYVPDMTGKYTFEIPVSSLDTAVAIAAHSVSKDTWYDRTLTIHSENARKFVEDGIYRMNVESSASMFKVINCLLTVENGNMSAVITLSGTGYDKLYMGTAKEAENAPAEDMIPFLVNSEGKYTYIVPVAGLDAEIEVAAYSISKDLWYDRKLTFLTEGMEKQELPSGDDTPTEDPSGGNSSGNTPSGGTGNSSANNGTPDTESKYESDLSGGTGRVNSETALKDGVYTPDKFSWSGGTGRVGISCNKVTITGGKAYATLVFGSDKYQYVKANGNVYYPSSKGNGSTTFVIPVALNKNNQIIGMTTAMSAAHEITYTIFIYLAEAAKADGMNVSGMTGSNEKLDDEAPEILGLEYESETEIAYAEYFRIYHYKGGITLLEIDLTKDTLRDPEKKTDEETDSEDATEDEKDSELTPEEEAIVQLYHGNIVKYLIVPEDTEIPAGLDKEMIMIEKPAEHVYAAAGEALQVMEDLELLETIAAIGYEKADCPSEKIAEALDKEEIVYAGSFDDPDYKALLKCKCDLSIFPSELLPKDEDEQEEKMETLDAIIERHTILELPMFVDRSADEEEELAQREWIKVYGALFGCEEKAAELFDAACKDAE